MADLFIKLPAIATIKPLEEANEMYLIVKSVVLMIYLALKVL